MRKLSLVLFAVVALFAACDKSDNDPRLVVITLDGYRWQEVFLGADSALLHSESFVPDTAEITQYFWRATPEERRELLMPFIWSYVPTHGYLIGNRAKGSAMIDANDKWYSYPCYCEMFSGQADNTIDTNNPVENVHNNVLEAANKDPRYAGSVMAVTSWESIRWAFANERAGIPASSGHEPSLVHTPTAAYFQGLATSQPNVFGYSERHDVVTFGYAMEILRVAHPKVLYVGFGDTDEWAHEHKYDVYLRTAQATDEYIRQIVEYCESDPFYKGKTTYMILTDHGRGRSVNHFSSHGASHPGSGETWFMAFGNGVPVLGETTGNGPFYEKQLAGSIAQVLGIEFQPDNGETCVSFDPKFCQEETKEFKEFDAQNVTPRGSGLLYTYSEGDFTSPKQVASAAAKASGVTPVFTTGMKKRDDHFGIVFKGLIKIPADGEYKMWIATDDGSMTYFDGQLLWDLDRNGSGYAESWLKLKAGYHSVEVQYFDDYGGDNIELGIDGCGIMHDNLPQEMLFH